MNIVAALISECERKPVCGGVGACVESGALSCFERIDLWWIELQPGSRERMICDGAAPGCDGLIGERAFGG